MQVDLSDLPRIRDLKLSPDVNPLLEADAITVKRRLVRSSRGEDLVNTVTGEVTGVAAIHQVEEKDDAEFVKVFAAGVSAAYALSKTGQRVFQAVLGAYEATPMSRGFADAVEIYWFGAGLAGKDIGMSEATFNRGLRELLGKGFLYPRSPGMYWVNPALFFKGDRVMFVKEYRRKRNAADVERRNELERQGQQQLGI